MLLIKPSANDDALPTRDEAVVGLAFAAPFSPLAFLLSFLFLPSIKSSSSTRNRTSWWQSSSCFHRSNLPPSRAIFVCRSIEIFFLSSPYISHGSLQANNKQVQGFFYIWNSRQRVFEEFFSKGMIRGFISFDVNRWSSLYKRMVSLIRTRCFCSFLSSR